MYQTKKWCIFNFLVFVSTLLIHIHQWLRYLSVRNIIYLLIPFLFVSRVSCLVTPQVLRLLTWAAVSSCPSLRGLLPAAGLGALPPPPPDSQWRNRSSTLTHRHLPIDTVLTHVLMYAVIRLNSSGDKKSLIHSVQLLETTYERFSCPLFYPHGLNPRTSEITENR